MPRALSTWQAAIPEDPAPITQTGLATQPIYAPRALGTVRLTTIALALCGALALSAAGCGDDDSGDSPSNTGNDELLTTDGFQAAYDAVSEEVGSDDELVSVQIAETGATFTIGGSEPRLFTYTGGELVEGEFQVIGPGQGGGGFPFTDLDPGAIDEIIAGVTAEGAQEVTTMTLETSSGVLAWTTTALGPGGPTLVFTAAPDGTDVQPADAGGAGAP